MARSMYAGTSGDFVINTTTGAPVPATAVTVWTDRVGGAQITDLLNAASEAVEYVTSDEFGLVVFYGPDPYSDVLWLDTGTGDRLATVPVEGLTITSDQVTGLGTMAVEDAADYAPLTGATFTGAISGTSASFGQTIVLSGGARFPVVNKTTTYTLTSTDHLVTCDATGGAFTVTLPVAASHAGREYVLIKTDSSGNAVTLDGNGSETINGATDQELAAQWDMIRVVSNGTAWFVI